MLLWIPVSQNNTILYTLVAQLYSFADAYHTRGHINTITKYITAKPEFTGKTMFVQLPVNLPQFTINFRQNVHIYIYMNEICINKINIHSYFKHLQC